MKTRNYDAKTEEELMNKILEEEKDIEENLQIKIAEKKGGLFKGSTMTATVVKLDEIADEVIEYLNGLLISMGLETNFEKAIKKGIIYIRMQSNNNGILIGKNGQTLEALKLIVKNVINNQIGMYPNLLLDVENYKEKQEQNIVRLAKNVAKEVQNTKIAAKLDSMNSYERRIVHSTLSDFKGIVTESEGEEPNRCVVIKPSE